MPAYLLAPALERLRAQVNTAFPNRNKASDGWIGDTAHQNQGSASDHNPWVSLDGQAYVTALDITHDPAAGFDIDTISDQLLVACRDNGENRIKYVIANGLIMDTRPQFQPYTWQPSSGHYHHIHISVHSDRRLLDGRDWRIPALSASGPQQPQRPSIPAWTLPPGHYYGLITGPNQSHGGYYSHEQPAIRLIQQALIRKGCVPGITNPNSSWADGLYEQQTFDAVARFQHAQMPGTEYYGQIWADDWAKLLG